MAYLKKQCRLHSGFVTVVTNLYFFRRNLLFNYFPIGIFRTAFSNRNFEQDHSLESSSELPLRYLFLWAFTNISKFEMKKFFFAAKPLVYKGYGVHKSYF